MRLFREFMIHPTVSRVQANAIRHANLFHIQTRTSMPVLDTFFRITLALNMTRIRRYFHPGRLEFEHDVPASGGTGSGFCMADAYG
jgi:hypothetical protein